MASSFSFVNSVLEKAGLVQYKDAFLNHDIDDQVLRMLPTSLENSKETSLFTQVVPHLEHRLQILQIVRSSETHGSQVLKIRTTTNTLQNHFQNETSTTAVVDFPCFSEVLDLSTTRSQQNYTSDYNASNGVRQNYEDTKRSLNNFDTIPFIEKCTICHNVLSFGHAGNGIKLQHCFHTYCRNCLLNHIIRGSEFYTRCPGFTDYRHRHTQCSESLVMHEIAWVLSNEDFMNYCNKIDKSVVVKTGNFNENLFHSLLNEGTNFKVPVSQKSPVASSSRNCYPVSFVQNAASTNSHRARSKTNKRPYTTLISNSPDVAFSNHNSGLLLNTEEAQCSFCTTILKPQRGIKMQMCLHVYCKNCLSSKIRYSGGLLVKCNIRNELPCTGFLSEDEIKAVATPDVYLEYIKKSSHHALKGMNFYACNQVGCAAQFELEEGSQRKAFLCPACQSVNCIPCRAIHEGLECEQYLKILCNAIHAGLDVNGREFRAILEKEKLQGFDHLCDNINRFATPNAGQEKRPRISYNETMRIMEQMHYIPTSKRFECFICANEEVQDGIVLQECLHTFCKECLVQVVRHSDDPEVKCPLDTCKAIISTREIQAVVPPDLFEKFLNRSVNLAEKIIPDTFHCLTKDCTGWCITEETATKFCCPVCCKVNCLLCKGLHDELTCQEYEKQLAADNSNRLIQRKNEQKGEKAVEKLVANRTFMRCPQCKMVCQKISGCNMVSCGSCKLPFTWRGK